MMPGRFHGTCRWTWINKDWVRFHQCAHDRVPFAYTTSDGRQKTMPLHFISDGGSIPRPFQNIVRRDELMPAWFLHDRDYALQDIPREVADADLDEMVYTLTAGYLWIRRGIIWSLVHACGEGSWAWNQTPKRKAQIAAVKALIPPGDLVFGT
ncbi:MAG: hypothetical protein WC554_05800 [Clostridia bacterium]|jgi:hypothetical protein